MKKDEVVIRSSSAELIVERADSQKNHMGLTTWQDRLFMSDFDKYMPELENEEISD